MNYRLLFVLFFVPFIAFAQTTYNNYDDFKQAVKTAQPGDEIILANGIYDDLGSITMDNIQATVDNPIMIRAEEVGGVTLNDKFFIDFRTCSYITIQGFNININEKSTTFKIQASNHIRLTQNVLDGIAEPAYKDNDTTDRNSSTWISIQGQWDDDVTISHHNRIDHNVFRNKKTLGNMIKIDGTNSEQVSQYDVIEYNHFKNMGPRAENEMEAIRIGWSKMSQSDGYCTVRHNLFEECNGDPEIISVKCNKNVISHNTFRGCQGTLSLRHGNESTVEGNFFFGDGKAGTGGVRIYGSDHHIINNYFEGLTGTKWDAPITLTEGDVEASSSSVSSHYRIERAIIANNTLINNDYGIEVGYDNVGKYSKPPRDVVMAYNVVQGSKNTLVNYINAPDNMTWVGNVMWVEGDATLGANVTFDGTQIIAQDPKLESETLAGFYKATEASPTLMLDETLVGAIEYDLEGQLRNTTTNYGADEYNTSTTQYRPLLSTDVGVIMDDYLESSSLELYFLRAGETKGLRISTNLAWNIQYEAPWISLSDTVGTGESPLTITISENTSGISRTASITITTVGIEDGELTKTVQIVQAGNDPDTLLVSDNNLVFETVVASQNIEVSSNREWIAASAEEWISFLPQSGSGNATLVVSVSENTSVVGRSGAITVSIENSLAEIINVTQPGILGDEVECDILSAIASTEQNETGKVNIASNVLDGDFDTRWSGEGIGAYIDLTLEAVQRISYLKVGHYKGDERTSSFHLLAWNAATEVFDTLLSQVTSVLSDEVLTIYDFDDVETNQLRLVGLGYANGSGVWNSYTEFEVWGWSAAAGISNQQNSKLSVIYPNPCQGVFSVSNGEGATISIYDLNGRKVFENKHLHTSKLIQTELSKGIYLVQLKKNRTVETQKLEIK